MSILRLVVGVVVAAALCAVLLYPPWELYRIRELHVPLPDCVMRAPLFTGPGADALFNCGIGRDPDYRALPASDKFIIRNEFLKRDEYKFKARVRVEQLALELLGITLAGGALLLALLRRRE